MTAAAAQCMPDGTVPAAGHIRAISTGLAVALAWRTGPARHVKMASHITVTSFADVQRGHSSKGGPDKALRSLVKAAFFRKSPKPIMQIIRLVFWLYNVILN